MTLVYGWDATHADLGSVPGGQGAGYTTESPNADGTSPGIRWDDADWAAHAGAVRICQDAGATDLTADVLDVEQFAATPADVPGWVNSAYHAYKAGVRPGQRFPAVYCSLSEVATVAAELHAHPPVVTPFLWVAHWGISMDDAAHLVDSTISGLDVVGVQFANRGAYDSDVWDSAWLDNVSGGPVSPPEPPAGNTLAGRLATMPELAQGAAVPAVRTLQALLFARGYQLGRTGPGGVGIDGEFGPLTHSAVVAFQASHGITVDGIVGPVTWPLLPLS